MNMGPQHPSAHGVFRMILTLEGETIVAVDPVIGYLHRCHEKLGETLTYVQYPSIASKTDYVSAMTAELCYVRAAEQLGQIEVPKRAQYLRVLAAELQRVASHLLWLGTWCMDMGGALGGGATMFLYCFREREMILDLFEALTGARLLYGFHQVGGTRYDIPAGWAEKVRETITHIEGRLDEYEGLLEGNTIFLVRTQGVGVISRELAQEVGVSGPLLRGSGFATTSAGWSPTPPTRTSPSTCRSRPRPTASRATASGCRSSARRSASCARRSRGSRGADLLAARRQVDRPGEAPKGEAYSRVEGARGEVGIYLVSDGSTKPYRMKWRGASFSNLAVARHILPGHKIADAVAILGSIDPVFGEVDR